MTVNLPTVKQLRYFVALVDEQHFGRAAEKSFVSQSAFSTAIRELERTLGTQLVERTNRQVNVTATGQSVAAAARDAGARHVVAVTSVGADPRARNVYLRTKGDLEQGLGALAARTSTREGRS